MSRETQIFDQNTGFQLHVNFNTGLCRVTDQRTDFKNTFDLSKPNEVGYLINLMNDLWEEVKEYRNNNAILLKKNTSLKEKIITKYNYLEELKHEYIYRKELSYSEKLIIEDFYDWLINSYLSGTQCL